MVSVQFDSIESQASYGIGLQLGQQLRESGLQELVPAALFAGIADVLADKEPSITLDVIHQALHTVQQRAVQLRQQQQQLWQQQNEQYLHDNRWHEGVQSTESGLQFRILHKGQGAIAGIQNRVRVHYSGKLIDGRVFDSSINHGQPAEFSISSVIAGWTEALIMMPEGSRWELTLPQYLAYGERGAGTNIPPYSTLIFEVELLQIVS